MWLEVDNLYAKISRATPAEVAWLRTYLSFPDARAAFRRGGPKRINMLQEFTMRFPAGLIPLLKRDAPLDGHQVQIIDKSSAAAPDPNADLAWLRDDQREAIAKVLARRRGLLSMPTGSGKTEVAVGLVRSVPSVPWLFAVHRTNLAQQAAERFDRRNTEHGAGQFGPAGIIGEGSWTEGTELTCATFQSLVAALRAGDPRATALLGRVGGFIGDECHSIGADTFGSVAMMTRNAGYRVGLSGTPLARGDRRSALTIAALGPVIFRLRPDDARLEGVLAKGTIRMLPVEQDSCAATYQGVYGELVVRSKKRNRKLVEMAQRAEKPAVLFVKQIKHGREIERELGRAGVRAGFVWGSHSSEHRTRAVRDLVAGRIEVLVCSVVFQEGIDIPSLRSVVIGSADRSIIAALQRIGRGMRVERNAAGEIIKDTFEVWDVLDRGHLWTERAANDRRRAYLREGHTVIAT